METTDTCSHLAKCYVFISAFHRELVEGSWNWGEQALPRLSKYTYLGVDFTSNGAWDEHVKSVLQNGRKKISQVHNNNELQNPRRNSNC